MKEFPLIISKRLLDVLSLIDHQIAKDLIELNGKSSTVISQTFIDIDVKDSRSITFVQSNKVYDILSVSEEIIQQDQLVLSKLKDVNIDHRIYSTNRSSTRIGRFVFNNFPDKYKNSANGSQGDADIETFSNMYKSVIERDVLFGLMDVVNGEDIAKWYSSSRYYEQNGSLGSSCMKNEPKSTFDVYVKNTENCSLVILYADSRKRTIKGRALLWKLKEPQDRYFMDRIYTCNYSYQQLFFDFAKFNNWLYKSDQSIGVDIAICDPSSRKVERMDLVSLATKEKYSRYPYCDTMAYFSYGNGTVSNNQKHGAQVQMQTTGGGYTELNNVWSKFNNTTIRKENSRYCLIGDDFVTKEQALRVYNWGEEGTKREKIYSVPNNELIAKMETVVMHEGEAKKISKYFPKEKCTWSPFLKTWVFTDSSVLVWTNIDKTESVLEYIKRLDYSFVELSGEFYLKDNISLKTGNIKKTRKTT